MLTSNILHRTSNIPPATQATHQIKPGSQRFAALRTSSGDHTGKETPVPIPNTAVKLSGPMIVPTSAKVGIARFYLCSQQAAKPRWDLPAGFLHAHLHNNEVQSSFFACAFCVLQIYCSLGESLLFWILRTRGPVWQNHLFPERRRAHELAESRKLRRSTQSTLPDYLVRLVRERVLRSGPTACSNDP